MSHEFNGNIKLTKIKQKFNTAKIGNIEEEIYEQFNSIDATRNIKQGMKIAVTAGSRGIANIDMIIFSVCKYLKEAGGEPFIVPAMGSHGGATAEGQINVLKKLGITEETMGVPIISSMEVMELGRTSNNAPVYMDKNAYYADGIVVVNRVKPHTDFRAKTESGLLKMISVGLGKEKGARSMHSHGLSSTIPEAAKISIKKASIMMGLAITENAKEETWKLEAIYPESFEKREAELLLEVQNNIPRLPSDVLDVLVVGEIGKMFSGTGMDTKVIGRMKILGEEEPEIPAIKKIVAADLADSSYGNALGIGLADITTKKLVDAIDFEATYANTIPTTYLERSKIPVTMKNDKHAIEVALSTIGDVDPDKVKMAIIKNTLDIQELYVTSDVLTDIDSDKIEIMCEDVPLTFDNEGNLALSF